MPNVQKIHQLIGKVGSDPTLIDQLLQSKDENSRKAVLVKLGILGANDPGFSRQDLKNEMITLMGGQPAPAGSGERVVEWVGALATAGAGAIAAACTADS